MQPPRLGADWPARDRRAKASRRPFCPGLPHRTPVPGSCAPCVITRRTACADPSPDPPGGHPPEPRSGGRPRPGAEPGARLSDHRDWVADSRYAGGSAGVLPRTRRRRICDSRNLSSPSVTAGQPPSVKLRGSCTREDGLDRTRPVTRFGSYRVRGRGLGRARARPVRRRRFDGGDEHQVTKGQGVVRGRRRRVVQGLWTTLRPRPYTTGRSRP